MCTEIDKHCEIVHKRLLMSSIETENQLFYGGSTIEIKCLCLQLKRSGTEYAAQKINFLTSAVANGRPLPTRKVSLGSD